MIEPYYTKLMILSFRILLILFCLLACLDMSIKSSGKLRRTLNFFILAFIPSILYTLGEILDIDVVLRHGKLLILGVGTLTFVFLLIGLTHFNDLIKEILYEFLKKKNQVLWCKDAVNKGYTRSQVQKFLVSSKFLDREIREVMYLYDTLKGKSLSKKADEGTNVEEENKSGEKIKT